MRACGEFMAQSVDRLKELLFDTEARALDTLAQRVEGIEHLTLDERRLREEISHKIDDVFNRAGTAERFEVSVAGVLDGALRRAEVDRHTELASAMAPLVVRTVKTEIRNSRDELVEALYPMTGRMVQAYVASAMKDIANDINRRLEQNPVMLRLRSLAAGKSVAEIAIADSQRLVVEELYLIRRGSGELVGRWPQAEPGSSGRDHVMSGVLTAINEFSTEALKDDGSALRQIDLGERQLYLRVSPTFLLAAKCSGSAPQAVETVLDQSFLEAMQDLQNLPGGGSPESSQCTPILASLSQNLETRLDAKTGEMANQATGVSPLKMLAWIIGLPLAAWLTWMLYADYKTERAHTIASKTLAAFSGLNGYPVSFDVSRLGSQVAISGLAPAIEVKDGLLERLRAALPGSVIVDRLSVLPNGLAALEPRIAGVTRDVTALAPEVAQARDAIAALDPKIAGVREQLAAVEQAFQAAAMTRALDRTQLRLREAQGVIVALAAASGPALNPDDVRRSVAGIEAGLSAVDRARAAAAKSGTTAAVQEFLSVAGGDIHDVEAKVSALAGFPVPPALRGDKNSSAADVSDALAAQADRLASIALAAAQVIEVKRSLPVIPAPVEMTPRERLIAFSRSYAIFFTNEVGFRLPEQAGATLDELAGLMRGNDVLIRVVGYTDDQGAADRNLALSEARSKAVIDALKARKVPADRLVAVGRFDAIGISPERGAASPNRRVEFEVGFVGEGAP